MRAVGEDALGAGVGVERHLLIAASGPDACLGTANVTIEAGATVTTLVVGGGAKVTCHSAVATVHQSGGRVDADVRMGATSYTLSGGSAYVENGSGSACTILNLEAAGRWYPIDGDVATLNRRGGFIGYDAAVSNVILGSSAFTNYAGSIPSDTGMVDVQNLTDYAAFGGGGANPL